MSTTICTISAPLDPALHPPWSPARKRLRAWHNRSKPLSIQWLVEAPHTERLSPLRCILWPDIQEILDDFGHSVERKSRKKMALRHSSSQLWVYLPLNTILTHHHIKTYQVYQSGYQLAILLPAVPERLQLMWWRGWGLPSSHIRMEVPDMCGMLKYVKHQWNFDFSYGS